MFFYSRNSPWDIWNALKCVMSQVLSLKSDQKHRDIGNSIGKKHRYNVHLFPCENQCDTTVGQILSRCHHCIGRTRILLGGNDGKITYQEGVGNREGWWVKTILILPTWGRGLSKTRKKCRHILLMVPNLYTFWSNKHIGIIKKPCYENLTRILSFQRIKESKEKLFILICLIFMFNPFFRFKLDSWYFFLGCLMMDQRLK